MKNILRAILSFTALAVIGLSVSCGSTDIDPVKLSVSEADAPNGVATCDPNNEAILQFEVNIDAPEGIKDFEAVVFFDGQEEIRGNIVTGDAPNFVHVFSIKCLEQAIDDATTVTFKVTDNKDQTDELVIDLKLAQ